MKAHAPRITRPLLAGLLLLALSAGGLAAQEELTVERIHGSSELRPSGLPNLRWMEDGQRFTFVRSNGEHAATDLIVEDAVSGERTVLVDGSTLVPPGAEQPIRIEGYEWSADESKLLIYTDVEGIWRRSTRGSYYVYDLASGELRPITARPGSQQYAKLSPDATRAGFVRDNDIWVVDLATGAETRLTHDGGEQIINGSFDWVYEEEFGIVDGWRWSPDGERIAFWRFDQTPIQIYEMQDLSPLYPTALRIPYPKAGDPNSFVQVGVVSAAGGDVSWLDIGEETDIYVPRMDWAESSSEIWLQRVNRHQNVVELMLGDVRTGETRTVLTERDDAWVDVDDDLTWLDDGRRFLWTSERDGYKHVYLYERAGGLVRQVTAGPWEVTAYHGHDPAAGWIYFSATEQGPLERHLYRVRLDGSGMERVTEGPGTHSVSVSPAFVYFIDSYSRAGTPPLYTLNRTDGERVRVLESNSALRDKLEEMRLGALEFTTMPGADGTALSAWVIRPPDFQEGRRYPVLMYVYGGPGSQTVVDAWGGDRYLWHQLLAQRGYVVASVDNRGTGGRGAAFTKSTYLDLGRLESDDQIAAARHIASLPWADPERIGIWGWSYGGYMTLLALLRDEEGIFRAGVSVAPVTHWKFYDTIYTERYMRTPLENPGGYDELAPVNLAEGLEAELLLIHGSGDDNVHFQQSVHMVDALIEANKQFDFMMYPNRAHAISGGGTRVHLYELMTGWVLEKL